MTKRRSHGGRSTGDTRESCESLGDPALHEIRAHLERVRARIEAIVSRWPPSVELAEILQHDLGYACHLAQVLEVEARRRELTRRQTC